MLRSLRSRLLLLTAIVVSVALAATLMVSRLAVRHEFARLEMHDRGRGLRSAADLLNERARSQGPAALTDSVLARLAASSTEDLILAAPDGGVLAASTPELRQARILRLPDGRIQIVAASRRGRSLSMRKALIVHAHAAEVRGADGSLIGWLHPFPRQGPPGSREPGFVLAVNRWLLIGMIGAGVLALTLALALSRRILGPVEALTQAARRMEAGDLGQRVTVKSGDEIGSLARAFNAMAESVQRNEALRRGLVADVAHELRTPLTNARCQIEAIQDGLTPASESAVRSLHEEVLLLGRLVDDLQELALAEAGQLPLHKLPVAIAPAVEAALAAVEARAADRGVALMADVPAGLPALDVDPGRLAQVLRNLLDNALAHTPRGGTIAVSADAGTGGATVRVRDSGPGIAPEHLPHVFDRFYRADPSRARASGGTGLGLAIVRQLIEAHGGRIAVESKAGQGACFSFSLPAASS